MLRREVRNLTVAGGAIIATLVLLSGATGPGVVLWAVTYAWVLWLCRKMWRGRRLGTHLLPRVVLAIGAAGLLIGHEFAQEWAAWLAITLHGLLIRGEQLTRRSYDYTGLRADGFNELTLRQKRSWTVRTYGPVMLLLSPVLLAAGWFRWNGWWWLAAAVIAVASAAAVVGDAFARRAVSRRADRALPDVLDRLAPAFVVYWDAPRNSQLQLAMWIPHLKRVGVPFYVMIRNRNSYEQAVSVCDGAPVLFCPTLATVERNRASSLRAAFYVNNAARNSHLVRYGELTHVQLLHGDSDKAPSFSPVTAMFDKVFVAGQAGIDRYAAHGVHIPDEKFVIVGRPQVMGIVRRTAESLPLAGLTVLYAPTWKGQHEDAAHSSIPHALDIVGAALERGCRVIFRPHPYTDRDPEFAKVSARTRALLESELAASGRRHLFGQVAESEMSLRDCFNASDLMIADVSSVIADYLFSEKPILLINPDETAEAFEANFPLAAAAYVVDGSRAQVGHALERSATDDPLGPVRRAKRTYYLGDFDDATYEDAFLSAAAAVSGAPWPPAHPVSPRLN